MKLTTHAKARAQQRAIPPLVMDWLLDYGHRERSFGLKRISFDKKSKRHLARHVGAQVVNEMSRYLRVAIVVDPSDVSRIAAMEPIQDRRNGARG